MEGETECPLPSKALPRLSEMETDGYDDECWLRDVVDTSTSEAGSCCYVVDSTYTCDEVECGGCYGRPYVIERAAVTAPVIENRDWILQGGPGPSLDGLTNEQRAQLAMFWSDNARAEHSSVAGFHRFALELMAHGAPAELLDAAQRAAVEELAHARICYTLASAYAGEPLGPGRMAIGESAPIAATLADLAVATLREGCMSETSAAWLASEIAERATDPAVRAAMRQIAIEEASHAELAWKTLRWTIEVGGEDVRNAIANELATISPLSLGGAANSIPAHGMLDGREIQTVVAQAFDELLTPMLRLVA